MSAFEPRAICSYCTCLPVLAKRILRCAAWRQIAPPLGPLARECAYLDEVEPSAERTVLGAARLLPQGPQSPHPGPERVLHHLGGKRVRWRCFEFSGLQLYRKTQQQSAAWAYSGYFGRWGGEGVLVGCCITRVARGGWSCRWSASAASSLSTTALSAYLEHKHTVRISLEQA
jgi:hypothetical protein